MKASSPDLRIRTKNFALRIIRLYASLSGDPVSQVIGKQLLRSAMSVGAHSREGKHSRSAAELFSKLSVGLQEMEESRYWLELLGECNAVKKERLNDLLQEADSLVATLFASTRTIKHKLR
jgi:four helix bundle protein